ncbi:MAG: molybdopterin molybdotransferase MoeA, partial [Bosea sp. (in: a-proteobacteria)]
STMSMTSPAEARRRILAAATPIRDIESVTLGEALGRTLAEHLAAQRTQPPFSASAMDGYAVRCEDLDGSTALSVIGQSAAGHPFTGAVGSGQAVRIFTGASVPAGADTILIQENARILADHRIIPTQGETKGRFVRRAGLDFKTGDILLQAGLVLDGRHVGLAASMGHVTLPVRRKPKVAILSTGDELVSPGEATGEGQIISSNAIALSAAIRQAGGEPHDHGIVPDTLAATRDAIMHASNDADILITSGGASVGEHDFVQAALIEAGFAIDFWKVAVRPGKPLMLGVRGKTLCVGLPGNPVSSMVCGLLFVAPLIKLLLGQDNPDADGREPARLLTALPANDMREEYMRAGLSRDSDGQWLVTPFSVQDSSIQRLLAAADALLIRPAHAPAADIGDTCQIIRF